MRDRVASCALACLGLAFASLVALHFLRRDLDPCSRHLSEYAVGSPGVLMTLAFLASGAGAAALAATFARTVEPSRVRTLAAAALLLAALTNAAMAIFVTDLSVPAADGRLLRTPSGKIHDWLARAHALAWPIVTVALPLALHRDPRWRRFVPWSLLTGTLVMAGLTARILSPPTTVGLTQRLWVLAILAWGIAHATAARHR